MMEFSEEKKTLYICNHVDEVCSDESILKMVNTFLEDMQTGVKLSALSIHGLKATSKKNGCSVEVKYDYDINQYEVIVIKYTPYIKEIQ